MCHWSENEIGSVFPPLMVREPHHERAGSQCERQTVRLGTTPLPAHPEALEGRAERQRPAMVVVGKEKEAGGKEKEAGGKGKEEKAEGEEKSPNDGG